MILADAIFMIEAIAPAFATLTKWEQDFILGQATMAMSGKIMELSPEQTKKLTAVYAKVRLEGAFPAGVLATYRADYKERNHR